MLQYRGPDCPQELAGEVSKPAIDPEINGGNVSKITYQASSSERSFEQTGPKRWMSGKLSTTR
jgi:hypothetical protein